MRIIVFASGGHYGRDNYTTVKWDIFAWIALKSYITACLIWIYSKDKFTLALRRGGGVGCSIANGIESDNFGFCIWVLWLGLGLLLESPPSPAWVRRPARLASEAGPGAGLWPDKISDEAPSGWPVWNKIKKKLIFWTLFKKCNF
jgi:hypothetical protein